MEPNIIISKPGKTVKGTVQLTGSKSECNRALIIEALSKGVVKVSNVSDAADAVTLQGVLAVHSPLTIDHSSSAIDHGPWTMDQKTVNIGPAGTAMRFLTAYLPLQDEEVILTGT